MNIQAKKQMVLDAIELLVADETDDRVSSLRIRSLEEIQTRVENEIDKLWTQAKSAS